MSERAALLTAIRDHLDDDTPRLVYADWLDEHPESDRDTATAEFIRASCLGRNHATGYMPRKAYQWLHGNWMRLVPLTLALHVRRYWLTHPNSPEVLSDVGWARDGREIVADMRMLVGNGDQDAAVDHYRLSLEFNCGFLQWWTCWAPNVFARIRGTLEVDQPFARARKFPLVTEWMWRH